MKKITPRSKKYRFWINWRSADGLEKLERIFNWPRPTLNRMFFNRLRLMATLTEGTLPEGPSFTRREYQLYDKVVTKTKGYIDIKFEYREYV